MNAQPVVKIEDLLKQFNLVTVLKNVSLELRPGSITGLLGANGSGKSTLIRHMVGLYLPDRGTCTTFGCDAGKLQPRELARIGYVHQEGRLVEWMTVAQMVRFVASYYPNWNAELEEDFLSKFELVGHAVVGDLSPGQRQVLAILLAIGSEPDLLLLDEPAAALDPIARRRFLDMLLGIIQDPKRTILISSHILSDVEKVIDRAIILDRGEVLRDVELDELQQEFVKLRISAVRGNLPDPLPLEGVLDCQRNGSEAVIVVRVPNGQDMLRAVREIDCACDVLPLSLEDLYGLVLSSRAERAMP